MSLTLSEITAWIAANASEPDVQRIREVMKQRTQALAAQAAAVITVGAEVTVVNISPAALKGTSGTVESIQGKFATVKFDEESTAQLLLARSRRINVPPDVKQYSMPGIPLVCLRLR